MNTKLKSMMLAAGLLLPLETIAAPCATFGSSWKAYSNTELGVALCYPAQWVVQAEDKDIYIRKRSSPPLKPTLPRKNNVDLLLNGKRLSEPNDYVAHFRIESGDFATANNKEAIFTDDQGTIRSGIGRFNNPKAQLASANGWLGYKTEIICSTTDLKTGFHAAGGQCLWILASDGQRNFVLDTQGNPANVAVSWKIAKSLRFTTAP